MSTDLVVRDDSLAPEIIGSAYDLAKQLSPTEFVPKDLRNRPEAVMAAILTGREMGIGPMSALSKIHIVEGRPAIAAELMRAVALGHGHEIWFEESSSTRVIVAGKRAGSEHVSKVTWTMDDAKRAGIAGKNNWRKYPRQMLVARATAELCRSIFADSLGGISYTVEELEDGGFDATGDGEPLPPEPVKSRKKGTVRRESPRKPAPPAPDEGPPLPHELDDAEDDVVDAEIVEEDDGLDDLTVPQLKLRLKKADKPVSGTKDELIARLRDEDDQDEDEDVVDAEEVPPDDELPPPPADVQGPVTDKQVQKLQILCRELGVRDGGDDVLYRAALQATYGVASSKDLSEKQAHGLIRILEEGRLMTDGSRRTPEEEAAVWLQKGADWLEERERKGLRGRMVDALRTVGSEHPQYPKLWERMTVLVSDPQDPAAWDDADQDELEALVVEAEGLAAEVDQ